MLGFTVIIKWQNLLVSVGPPIALKLVYLVLLKRLSLSVFKLVLPETEVVSTGRRDSCQPLNVALRDSIVDERNFEKNLSNSDVAGAHSRTTDRRKGGPGCRRYKQAET